MEVYDSNRQIVLTADLFGQLSTITAGGQEFRELQHEYLPKDDDTDTSASTTQTGSTRQDVAIETQPNTGGNENSPSVDQIKRTIDAYAADGSGDALRAKELWESSGAGTYESSSEADFAFASDLAFWCREDATLMYRCICRSNRYRSKWDEVHYSDESTYADETIGKAIDTNYDQFSGRYVQ
jgi:putative DNA primase/helicase